MACSFLWERVKGPGQRWHGDGGDERQSAAIQQAREAPSLVWKAREQEGTHERCTVVVLGQKGGRAEEASRYVTGEGVTAQRAHERPQAGQGQRHPERFGHDHQRERPEVDSDERECGGGPAKARGPPDRGRVVRERLARQGVGQNGHQAEHDQGRGARDRGRHSEHDEEGSEVPGVQEGPAHLPLRVRPEGAQVQPLQVEGHAARRNDVAGLVGVKGRQALRVTLVGEEASRRRREEQQRGSPEGAQAQSRAHAEESTRCSPSLPRPGRANEGVRRELGPRRGCTMGPRTRAARPSVSARVNNSAQGKRGDGVIPTGRGRSPWGRAGRDVVDRDR
jgi:hypothetical protein